MTEHRYTMTMISQSDLRTLVEWLEGKQAKCGVCGEPLSATAENTINVFVPHRGRGFELMRWTRPDTPTEQRRRQRGAMGWIQDLKRPLSAFYLAGTHAARVVCDNCGHMVLFDAEKVGIWPSTED